MTSLQYAAIQALAGAAALSVLLFDKRGRQHKPLYAWLAYLMFIQAAALVVAAAYRLDNLITWLLILGLAVHTGNILLARGNVGKIQPVPKWRIPAPRHVVKPRIRIKLKPKEQTHG